MNFLGYLPREITSMSLYDLLVLPEDKNLLFDTLNKESEEVHNLVLNVKRGQRGGNNESGEQNGEQNEQEQEQEQQNEDKDDNSPNEEVNGDQKEELALERMELFGYFKKLEDPDGGRLGDPVSAGVFGSDDENASVKSALSRQGGERGMIVVKINWPYIITFSYDFQEKLSSFALLDFKFGICFGKSR